jgi:hypothetical protein
VGRFRGMQLVWLSWAIHHGGAGIISDTFPIYGRSRSPYIVIASVAGLVRRPPAGGDHRRQPPLLLCSAVPCGPRVGIHQPHTHSYCTAAVARARS